MAVSSEAKIVDTYSIDFGILYSRVYRIYGCKMTDYIPSGVTNNQPNPN